MTPQEIRQQLAALDQVLVERQSDADALALPVVSGDPGAGAKLAALHAEIERMRRDRNVLEQALSAAIEQERRAADQAAEDARQAHLAAAAGHAADVVALGERLDELIETVVATMSEMARSERAVHDAFRRAGVRDRGGIVGRQGIAGTALDVLTARVQGLKLSDHRSIGHRAADAWRNPLAGVVPRADLLPAAPAPFIPPVIRREVAA